MHPLRFDSLVDLIDGYAELASAAASAAQPAHVMQLGQRIGATVAQYLRDVADHRLDDLSVYYIDKYYRIYNQLSQIDTRVYPILAHIGSAFEAHTRTRTRPIGYLVDNGLTPDRLTHLQDFFNRLGFTTISPELLAPALAGHDGELSFEQVEQEAKMLCERLLADAIESRRNVIFVSYHHELAEWTAIAGQLAEAGYLVTFRNDAPVDGSEIHIL